MVNKYKHLKCRGKVNRMRIYNNYYLRSLVAYKNKDGMIFYNDAGGRVLKREHCVVLFEEKHTRKIAICIVGRGVAKSFCEIFDIKMPRFKKIK